MVYNLTNFTSEPSLFAFMNASNQITGGLFILLALGVLTVIIMVSLMRFGAGTAVSTALFVSSLVGMLLTLLGMVDVSFLPYFILPLAMAIVGVFIANRNTGGGL